MSSATIEALIEVLERSEAVYQQLLPVFEQEKRAAHTSDPESFSCAVEEKEELLAQLRPLERQRQMLINQLSAAWHLPAGELRLSTLVQHTRGEQAVRIKRLSSSLAGLLQNLKAANEENRALIQHCLDIVHGALGCLQHWMMPTKVYGASGRMNLDKHSGKLVSGVI